jgi:ATP-dependent helicase/nuclease subunit B
MELGLADIRLTGIADRLDRLTDGTVDIIDYKTGSSPSPKEARALLDPQLALEAAALKAGAFRAVGPARPHSLRYVRLKPGSRFAVDTVDNEGGRGRDTKSTDQLAEASLSELRKLLAALMSGRHGFASRLIVQKERDYGGEYDHLARVAEWATADSEDDDEE